MNNLNDKNTRKLIVEICEVHDFIDDCLNNYDQKITHADAQKITELNNEILQILEKYKS